MSNSNPYMVRVIKKQSVIYPSSSLFYDLLNTTWHTRDKIADNVIFDPPPLLFNALPKFSQVLRRVVLMNSLLENMPKVLYRIEIWALRGSIHDIESNPLKIGPGDSAGVFGGYHLVAG